MISLSRYDIERGKRERERERERGERPINSGRTSYARDFVTACTRSPASNCTKLITCVPAAFLCHADKLPMPGQ